MLHYKARVSKMKHKATYQLLTHWWGHVLWTRQKRPIGWVWYIQPKTEPECKSFLFRVWSKIDLSDLKSVGKQRNPHQVAGLSSFQPIRLLENDIIALKWGLMTSQKGIKVLVSLETAFWIVDSGESTALEKNKVIKMAAQYGTSSVSGTWTPDKLPDMAMEQKNLMWVWRWLWYGDTLYGEWLHVLSSMVQSNCLGERAPPSPALPIWHYWVCWFANKMSILFIDYLQFYK